MIRDFPEAEIALVVDRHIRGSNQKVSNLENMLPAAHHEILVLADSDMRVDRRYLAAVTAPLGERGIGVVTCLYKAASTGGVWSDLGGAAHQFRVSAERAPRRCAGRRAAAALAPRSRSAVRPSAASAGLRRCATSWPTTAESATRCRAQGLAVVLSPYLVEARVHEPSFIALWRHELRWARTVRRLSPAGFIGSVATHPLALGFLAAAASGLRLTPCILFGFTCLLRWAAARAVARVLGLRTERLWLLPLRDLLSFAVFVASFFGRKVFWRDQNFHVEPSGRMTLVDGEKGL